MDFHLELITRILVGTALASVIGIERHIHHRAAGLRVHVIVGMASATFMTIGTWQGHFQDLTHATAETSSIGAAVVSGIGFLAGGAILRNGITVQGMTTAAALWLVTAIGLSSGAGMYPESVLATILGTLALMVLRRIERRGEPLAGWKVQLTLTKEASPWSDIRQKLEEGGATVVRFRLDRRLSGHGQSVVTFYLQLPRGRGPEQMAFLETDPGIKRMRVKALK